MQTAHAQSQPSTGQKHSPEGSGQLTGPGETVTNELGWGGTNPNIGGPSPWGAPTSRPSGTADVVVDTQDKEAWPSIGDNSETGSNIDDVETASAKSGSVISSSSNPGASLGDSLSTSSGLGGQQQSTSSMGWGSLDGDKLSSSGNSWGIGPDSTTLGSGGMWGASTNATSSSNTLTSGWGMGSNSRVDSGAELNGSQSGWQGMTFPGSGINLQQNVAASSAEVSGWGTTNSTSVIASSISSSLDSKGASAIGSLWNNTNSGASGGGWGSAEPPPKPDSQGSGWGSPSPTPALTNTGTEAWGQPKSNKPPNMSSGWGQQPQSATTGWGQPNEPQKATTSSWGEPSKPTTPSSGWGQPEPKSNTEASAWGQPAAKPDATASGLGAKPVNNPAQPQWGGASCTPPNTSASWGAPAPAPPSSQAHSAWGGQSVQQPGNVQQQLPRPIGAAQPPQQPSSWADAASRGLPPKSLERSVSREDIIKSAVNSNEGWGKTPVRQDTSWDMEESPKLPRKPLSSTSSSNSSQENTWNHPNDGTAIWEMSKGEQPQPPPSSNSWGNQAASNAPRPPQQVGPASSTHWGNPDADGGTWEGPPDAQKSQSTTSMWNGPQSVQSRPPGPPQSNNWGGNSSNTWGGDDKSGHWGSGSSSSDWGSNKSDNGMPPNQGAGWAGKKDDNVWDRDGTHSWGGGGGPPSRSSSGTDIGMWASEGNRSGSSSSWAEEASGHSAGWARSGPPSAGVDNGTSFWGDPGPGKTNWVNRPPSQPDRPAWAQQPKGWGDGPPKNDAPMWGQDPKAGGWTEQSGWSAMKPRQPGPGNWGEASDWNAVKGAMSNDMSKPPPLPQARYKMLLQLTNMGFRKEDAQRALINNDMNLESAIRELVQNATAGHELDGEQKGRALRSMHSSREDISADPHTDLSNPLVPPQLAAANQAAAALTNAQLAAHSTTALANHLNPATSLQNPSSLTASSINPMLQKPLAQQVGKQPSPQPIALHSKGQPIIGAPSRHQILHSQLAQQLQIAVQTGLVSPQLLNQGQLAPNMLIMLQQLLQLSYLLQRLVAQQQVVQQCRKLSPSAQRSQLEQLALMITKIKRQIVHQQQAIQTQQVMSKQQAVPPPVVPVNPTSQAPATVVPSDPNKELDLASLTLGASNTGPPGQSNSQPQSKLNQWIKDSGQGGERAPGFKPSLQQSHSTPNLQSKEEAAGSLGLSDSTWSPSVSGGNGVSWPASASAVNTVSASLAAEAKAAVSSTDSPASTSATSSTSSTTAVETAAALDIEEFVPGKPWQGMTIKSVEDDPFITPASVSRSLSVSQVREDQLSILGGGNKSSANNSPTPGMGDSWVGKQAWSYADDWNQKGNPGRQPPGINANRVGGYNRSMSMPAGAGLPQRGWSNQQQSNWLLLKNLSPRIDSSTLETVCKQHGPLQTFYLSAQSGQALVCYKNRDAALRAQQALNTCQLGNTTIVAEFTNDSDAAVYTAKMMAAPTVDTSRSLANPWAQGPQTAPIMAGHLGGQMKADSNLPPGGGGMWGSSTLWGDDHSLLPGNLL